LAIERQTKADLLFMLKSLKVILLVLLLVVVSVVINEISTFDYIYPEYRIDIEEINVTSSKSVIFQEQNSIKPVKYIGTLDFDTIPESIRKAVFINYMLPAIVIEHERLLDLLRHVEFIERRMVNKNWHRQHLNQDGALPMFFRRQTILLELCLFQVRNSDGNF
jgi:uncharacterized FlgJ-related protein